MPDVSNFTLRPLSGADFISVLVAKFVTTGPLARHVPGARHFRFYRRIIRLRNDHVHKRLMGSGQP